jgi:uncharacterized protein (TIGR03000 family)
MKHTLTTSIALVAMVALACDTQAFWGSRGSYGSAGSYGSSGSYGSFGSSGSYGSTGSYGSSGSYASSGSYGSHGSNGGLFARHRARKAARRAAWGCSGSYASSGSYGSTGSYGSNGSYGSAGSAGSYSTPVSYDAGCDCVTTTTEGSTVATTSGMLRVEVPADAKVFVNDKLTTSTGTHRQYVSNGLKAGQNYSYDVRVEYTVDGKPVTENKQITLTAGSDELLSFSAPAAEPVATTLKMNVPAEAKVTLAGVSTSTTGESREYTTGRLSAGQEWADYVVTVEFAGERQEKTITLRGGELTELDFDFGTKVAARN